MKKALRWIIAVAVLAAVVWCGAAMADTVASGTCGANGDNLTWTLDDTGTLAISGFGEMYDYGEGSSPWREYGLSISTVELSDKMTTIGANAFFGCENLESISIPSAVTRIGEEAFYFCYSLKIITIPNNVTTIGLDAFYYCKSLESITIPDSVTSIGDYAFANCYRLQRIVIPESVSTFGSSIFGNCYPTVYCYSYTDAHYWAVDQGLNIVLLDSTTPAEIRGIDLEENFRFAVGDQRPLGCSVFPDFDNPTVTWSSSNPSVIQVVDGVITGLQPGTATITASCDNASDSVTITVYTAATDFELSPSTAWVLAMTENCTISVVNLTPADAEISLSWKCSNTELATVDANGYVTTSRPGEVTITATSERGIVRTAKIYLCYPVQNVVLEAPQDKLITGRDMQLTAHVTTRDMELENQLVTFSSSDPTIATVDAKTGVVHGIAPGFVTITATSKSNKTSSVDIQVLDACIEHILVTDEAVDPTCEETGLTEGSHCAVCGEILVAQEVVSALGHDWGEVAYTWAEDNSSVTATRVCGHDENHVETETVEVTSEVTLQPTCLTMGETTYTSDGFENAAFAVQTKTLENVDALGHSWGEAVYTWSADNTSVTVTRACANDAEHVETETVTVAAVITLQPTCTEPGETTYTSADFENEAFAVQTKVLANIDPLGHESVTDEAVAATCTATGLTEGSHCAVCGEVIIAQEVIPLTVHHYAIIAAVPATCEEAGFTSYVSCTECGYVLIGGSEVPALGHDWGEPTYTWNAENTEVTATRVCNHDAEHVEIGISGIMMENITLEPTCTEPGETTYTCGDFENPAFVAQSITLADIPALGHTIVVSEEAVEPTCEEDGLTESSYCSVCGEVISSQEVVSALGHDWGEPTYTWADDNSSVTAIRVCNHDSAHIETETVGVNEEVIQEPTCYMNGEIIYTSNAFDNDAFSIQSLSLSTDPYHEPIISNGGMEPTCEEDGYTASSYCEHCGEIFESQDVIPALGHDWGDFTYIWAEDNSTVTAGRICLRDSSHILPYETVLTSREITKEPTCTEPGETTYTSEAFENASFTVQTKTLTNVDALGHDWSEPTYTWNEDNTGVIATRVCSRNADHVETDTVAAAAEITLQPTCTESGETTYTSEAFENASFTVQTKTLMNVDALGHDWSEPTYTWNAENTEVTATRVCARDAEHVETEISGIMMENITLEPTCTEPGETTYTCGDFENPAFVAQSITLADIPALGHTIVVSEEAVEPTCEEDGLTESSYCSVCGEVISSQEVVSALGHDWGEPTYTWADDNSTVTASHICQRDAHHTESETVGVTSVVTKEPTVTDMGETTYTSNTFSNEAFTVQSKTLVDIDRLDQTIVDYGFDGNIKWVLRDDGSLTISGNGAMKNYSSKYESGNYITTAPWGISATNVVIKDGVTQIGSCAFDGCNMTSITIPDSVTSIGNNAFSGSGLTHITIPDSVTTIGNYVFAECADLISVTLSGSITNPNALYFSGCSSLKNFTIPNGVTYIIDNAFADCVSLESITIPDSVTRIGYYAFWNCSSMKSITIPDSVTNIGSGAFNNCSSLTSVTIPNNVTIISDELFFFCSSLMAVTIPDSVTSIGSNAFADCVSLTNITIPDNVTHIGDYAFCFCDNLKKVLFTSTDTNAEISIGQDIFYYIRPTIYCHIDTVPYRYYMNDGRLDVICLEDIMPNIIRTIVLQDDIQMAYGDTTNLVYSVFPNDGTPINWTSSNPELLTVTDGTVTALNPGTVTVTASIGDTSDSVTIEIYTPATGLVLNTTEAWLQNSRESIQLSVAEYIPENASAIVAWKSSDTTLATVDRDGYVTTLKPGDVTITATTDKGITASCLLHLTYPVTSVVLNQEAPATVNIGETVQLVASVKTTRDTYTNKLVTFTSSDESIATVNADGVVTAVHPGTVTITAAASTGQSATAEITVQCVDHEPVTDEAVAPTCTEPGLSEGSHCALCGEILVPQETVDALGHTPVTDAAVDATCTATGLTEGSHCAVCGEVLTAQEIVPKISHTYVSDPPVAATCESTGLTYGFHCGVCGHVFVAQEEIPALGHIPVTDEAVEPTCEETGLTEGSHCERCGTVLVEQEILEALGHTPVTDEAVASTCTENGLTEGSHCAVCGEILTAQEVIPMLGHVYIADEPVAATCEHTGLTYGFHCDVCGKVFVAQNETPMLGHDWGEPTYTWSEDNTTVTATRVCTRDASHIHEETVAVLRIATVSPTQTTEGEYKFVSAAFEDADCTVQEKAGGTIPALNGLSAPIFPAQLTTIEDEAFEDTFFQAIIIPDTVTTIGNRAFANCRNLIYVRIPASITNIPADAFSGCPNVIIDRLSD